MSKEIVAQNQETELMAVPEGSWGTENISSQDLLISKMLLMQPLSTLVVDGKATPGDMVDSVSQQILGNKNKPVEIIPIHMTKTWSIFKNVGGKFEYDHMEPITPANEQQPYEFTVDGVQYQRNKDMNFFVLLRSEAKEASAFPRVITFRRTSSMAGRNLATHFAKAAMEKMPPAAYAFNVSCTMEKNDKGSYFVYHVERTTRTEVPEIAAAYRWYKTLQTQTHRVDESENEGEQAKAPASNTQEY